MKLHFLYVLLFVGIILIPIPGSAQFPSEKEVNETEARVIPYTLPDPLMMFNGERVKNKKEWRSFQRAYIYHLFEKYVYGRFPTKFIEMSSRVIEESNNALGGIAKRKQVRLYLSQKDSSIYIDVLMYLPKTTHGGTAVFLGLNFNGNATINPDPNIILSKKPGRLNKFKAPNGDSSRGYMKSRYPLKTIIENGIGVVTANYGDVEMDKKDGWKVGIRTTLQNELDIKPEEWSAIGAWAWELSRIMDYLETDKDINSKRVAVFGHSRLGKTALWAGASDPRFSIVISNCSGEGGAALARRWFGETTKKINDQFPHWFVEKYKDFNGRDFSLPVDQHELLSLIAPRPLYIATASEDLWSDPKGQFLSAWHAGEVYRLFGKKGLGRTEMPQVNTPIGNTIHYHNREGEHDVTLYDWKQYCKFARKYWNK